MAKSNAKLKWGIATGVIGLAILVVMQLNFGDNLVYFYTPDEALAKVEELDDKTIKIGAMVKPGTVNWDAKALELDFVITDLKGHEIAVSHKGIKPDMFREGQGVVVEGRLTDNGKAFAARQLMVKHSEEYRKPEDHTQMNKALLEQSIFKE